MKKSFLKFSMLLLGMTLIFTGCNKDKEDPDDTAEQSTNASDDSNYQAESDLAIEEANMVFSGSSLAGARVSGTNAVSVCGASIDSSAIGTNKIILNFDGTSSCYFNSRKRAGQIVLQLTPGKKWNDAGAVITITFNDYKVTRLSDNKSLTLKGTHVVTNMNGGLSKNLAINGTLLHKIRATMELTFDDGTKRSWIAARTRTIARTGALDYSITIGGDTTINGQLIAVGGTTRRGIPFTGIISTPVVAQTCSGLWKITSGVKVYKGITRELTVTYGVKSDGNIDGTCSSYGYKLNWTNLKGDPKTAVISY